MRTSNFGRVAAAAVVGLAISAPSSATVWDFFGLAGGTTHALGSSYTFTQGSQSILAEAVIPGAPGVWNLPIPRSAKNCTNYKATPNDPCIMAKGPTPPDERGLGLLPNQDYEIFYHDGIEITPTGGHLTDIRVGSAQIDESWEVWGCGLKGPCKWIAGGLGNSTGFVDVTSGLGGYVSYVLDVPCKKGTLCFGKKATGGDNILLVSVTTATGVPEPATLTLVALGLAGIGLARRRKS